MAGDVYFGGGIHVLVFGGWSLVFGLWRKDFGRMSLASGLWSLVFGRRSLGAGLWSLEESLWVLDFGFWSLVFGEDLEEKFKILIKINQRLIAKEQRLLYQD